MLNRRNLFKFAGFSVAATQVKAEPLEEESNPEEYGLLRIANITDSWFAGSFYIGHPEFKNGRVEYRYSTMEFRNDPLDGTPNREVYAPVSEQSVVEVRVRDPYWKNFKITPTWGYQAGFYSPDILVWDGTEILRA